MRFSYGLIEVGLVFNGVCTICGYVKFANYSNYSVGGGGGRYGVKNR